MALDRLRVRTNVILLLNVKKLQFNQVFNGNMYCIDRHIEDSKNDKKLILTITALPERQCAAE